MPTISHLSTALLGMGLVVTASVATAADMTVTLLGTGTPSPRADRFSQSTLIEAGSERLIFDMGRGVTIRLAQRKVPFGTITAHFITHLHSDHLTGLPDLWLTGWLGTPYASRKAPMIVYGPAGTRAMTDNLTKAFAEDIRIRTEDEHLPAAGIAFDAHDLAPGVVYERNGVRVSALEVNHGERIKPAYGYVVEFDGKKVVLSGDTKYDERVAQAAKGADLLIHEVADIDPETVKTFPSYREIAAHHTDPEEAGRIFSQARPKLAVFAHIVYAAPNPRPDVDPDNLLRRTRSTYDGPVMIGRDLMSFVIADKVIAHDPEGKPIEPPK